MANDNLFLLKGGASGCLRMTGKYSKTAFSTINEAFAEEGISIPSSPVSCTAMLAKKMGVSEKHTIMAAGLAGGIGLCGEACGALGTALWINGMKFSKDTEVKSLWQDKKFSKEFEDIIERFLKSSDYEFECSKIVGRKFENTNDHANFLKDGGCAGIINALSSK